MQNFKNFLAAVRRDASYKELLEVFLATAAERNPAGVSALRAESREEQRAILLRMLLEAEQMLQYELDRFARGDRTSINSEVPKAIEDLRAYRNKNFMMS